jgi:hypothetical protein
MTDAKPPYDVAISFRMQDMEIARKLYDELSGSLSVFFYARKQEEIVGRSGHDAFRNPFLDARAVVVLFRDPWGQHGWTEVEQSAIQDGCLKHGWPHLLFVAMDATSKKPNWVPNHPIRYNIEEFGFDDLVSAIKSRVMELGGILKPMTPLRAAELHKAEEEYQIDRKAFLNDGHDRVQSELTIVRQVIRQHCAEIIEKGLITGFRASASPNRMGLATDRVSMVVGLEPMFGQAGRVAFEIKEELGYAFLPGEPRGIQYGAPKLLATTKYKPDLNRDRMVVWRSGDKQLTSEALASEIVQKFIQLSQKHLA